MEDQQPKIGRPSDFTPELADRICAEISQGFSLRTICKADDMPCVATIFNWFRKHPTFVEQYARAKDEQADSLVEEILDIADDGSNDWMERTGKDGESVGWQLNGEHVQRSKLRVDSRKWIASKLKPKKYGERITQEVSGPDGGPIVTNARDLSVLTDDELAAFTAISRKLTESRSAGSGAEAESTEQD